VRLLRSCARAFQAVLLVGFLRDEVARVRAMLDEMGAEFVRVVLLDKQMLEGTLGAALAAPPAMPPLQPTATGVPRVLFLSGMSGAEAVSVIDAFQRLGALRLGVAPHDAQLLMHSDACYLRATQSCRRPYLLRLCRAASTSRCERCVQNMRRLCGTALRRRARAHAQLLEEIQGDDDRLGAAAQQ
jgi:hypothetical protein